MNTTAGRRVARALRAGGPEVIEIGLEDLAPLKTGEVRVRVEAVGLNHAETLIRSGAYSVRFPFPYGVGLEGAGTVVEASHDAEILPGTRVCWTAIFGSCATLVTTPASMLARLPDGLSFEEGARLAHAGVTAAGLIRHYPLEEGSLAAVWGAAGAVGLMLVGFLTERRVKVIGIASGTRVDAVRAAGADCVIDRTSEDVVDAVRRYTGRDGVAAVFDPVGTATYTTSLQLLKPRGCLINYGQLSGELPKVDLMQLMDAGSVFVTKYGPRAGLVEPHRVAHLISEALLLAARRPVTSPVSKRFPLDRVADAYRALESNPPGKILVLPQKPCEADAPVSDLSD